MEDANILEPLVVKAKNRTELENRLNRQLIQRSRGSYWLGDIEDDHYTVDVHLSYYIDTPKGTRCVHDYFPRILRIGIKRKKSVLEASLPSSKKIGDQFHEAERLRDKAILQVVSTSFSPIVAIVNRTAGHLAKFESMYVNRFLNGERLFPHRDLKVDYIIYLESQGIIEGDDRKGYALTHDAVNYIRQFRQSFSHLDSKFTSEKSSVPFISLCLRDWNYLGTEMNLTTITSYFRLLTAIFDHHYRAKTRSSETVDTPITLTGIQRQIARFGWGKQGPDSLRPRLQHLRDAGAVHFESDYIVHLNEEWYNIALSKTSTLIESIMDQLSNSISPRAY